MLVQLPTCAIYRISREGEPPASPDESPLALGLGMARIGDGDFGDVGLVEVAPDQWSFDYLDNYEVSQTGVVADCVSVPAEGAPVGFVLPQEVGGRSISPHVVMREATGLVPYENLAAVREQHGQIAIGHIWSEPDGQGYRHCARCKCRLHRSL